MEKVEIKNARWKIGLFLLGSLAFTAGGIDLVKDGEILGWLAILLFGGGSFVFLRMLLRSPLRLTIDEAGIRDHNLGIRPIKWEDIKSVQVGSVAGNDFLSLKVKNAKTYCRQLSNTKKAIAAVNRALGETDITISLSGINVRTEEVVEIVQQYLQSSRRKNRQVRT